jgi:hypothetical protein
MDVLSPADVWWSALLLSGVVAHVLELRARRTTAPADRPRTDVEPRALTHV